jgi:hypothetical protein
MKGPITLGTFQRLIEGIKNPEEHKQLRLDLIRRIEGITGRPLVVYLATFEAVPGGRNMIAAEDKVYFSELLEDVPGDRVDILLNSPGGVAESVEIVVGLLRPRFAEVRFFVPNAAKSAATMFALSGNVVLMDERSELGPFDPQIVLPTAAGPVIVPAQTILDGFDRARKIIEKEGPSALVPFMPLISKYDLHIFELCENARELSRQLVTGWLKRYMLAACSDADVRAERIVSHFLEYRQHLSHGRGISIDHARQAGVVAQDLRETPELRALQWELYCAGELYLQRAMAQKLFENARGTSLSRRVQVQQVSLQLPVQPPPSQPDKQSGSN